MKRPASNKLQSTILITVNIVLFAVVFVLFLSYRTDSIARLRNENESNVVNLNKSAASIASSFLVNGQSDLADIVQYAEGRGFGYDELLNYMESSTSTAERRFEVIGTDYTGHVVAPGMNGVFPTVDYTHGDYGALWSIFSADQIEKAGNVHVRSLPAFTDKYTGVRSFALYAYVTLPDPDGGESVYTILSVNGTKDTLDAFNVESGYADMSSALIADDGSYVLSGANFKSDNFYQYLYIYNDLSLDEKNAVRDEVMANGTGSLYYKDSKSRETFYAYTAIENSEWTCVTAVPSTSFRVADNDVAFAMSAVIIIIVLLVVDVVWMQMTNRKLKTSMDMERVANNAKTEFLSRMSHDIRTPLNGIIGLTTLALEEKNPPKTSEYLEKVKSSGDFLQGLINDILDINKIESGNMELHAEPYTIADLCTYINAVIKPLCDAKNIEFTIHDSTSECTMMFDRLRINQILFNILSNAAKFTPDGGRVDLFCRITPLEGQKRLCLFSVTDTGIGMSEKFQHHMFEPFTQESTKQSGGGTGLGLTIVQNLVNLMDGEIEVDSTMGKGTTITIRVTADEVAADGTLGKTKKKTFSETVLKGMHILLCEDNMINIIVARNMLEKFGVTVEIAENGKLGVALFSSSAKNHFDAILMDVMMPEMDGITATRAIRALEREDAKRVPIIATTANAYDKDVAACLEAGMTAHIAKPIDPTRLLEALARTRGE